ncbi:MAG: glycosyltransferase family 39 protein [Rhizobiales bacterium]|nr:glycosyltransferase family 39 protein [Hyphomicrobiales bacterium]
MHASSASTAPRPDRSPNWGTAAIAAALFFGMFVIYWLSIPDHFNEIYNNRRFFDSDGEFITRQFYQNKTFTHNNHLLYHVSARLLFEAGLDVVRSHKFLSVFWGALGVSILFVGGRYWTGRLLPALIAALFVGGAAAYWFFAATIDTYVPQVASGAAALVAALVCLRTQRPAAYFALGALLGLAFLFRTDGFLMATTALVILERPRDPWRRLAALAAGGVLVGVVGYALLAWRFYGVPPAEALAFAFPDRPEMAAGQWGRWANVDPASLWLTFAGAAGRAIVLAIVDPAGRRSGAGREPAFLTLLGLAWLLPRIVFYAWWDPFDPFLFACTSLPAFWLTWLHAFGTPVEASRWTKPMLAGAAVLVAAIWLHNIVYLVMPMRAASVG